MTAIEFENISKQYRLGLVSTGTLSHDLNRFWQTKILHREDPYLKVGETNDRAHKGNSDYVWALKDINFKVEQGDVVGIIGRNGAGKSTLLKLLSRVTAPTTGIIRAKGRIASLLEVGTGFHPEMTGRENIYMNGAIMGMSRSEITRKLDEIVDFSGCERYLDTPVKRYSSGMTVRLGFAIAAHLEPEILVVDEVLAVGDAEFQKKAIGKMQDASRGEGRTVLFVSHNMGAVKNLCKTGLLLENGMIRNTGKVNDIVDEYENQQYSFAVNLEKSNRQGTGSAILTNFFVTDSSGTSTTSLLTGESYTFNFNVEVKKEGSYNLGFSLFSLSGHMFCNLYSEWQNILFDLPKGKYTISCNIKSFPFSEQTLYVRGLIYSGSILVDWPKANLSELRIEHGDFYKTGKRPKNKIDFLIKGDWECQNLA